MLVLTLVGLGVASYLTYVHYAGINPVCTAGGSCLKVQTSIYSKLAGVPVALMGLIGYVAIMASLLAPEDERSRFATMALTVVGFGFSAYLTYRELFSIHAVCEQCASSAAILTVLMFLSIWRFLRGDARTPGVSASAQTPGQEPATPLGAAHPGACHRRALLRAPNTRPRALRRPGDPGARWSIRPFADQLGRATEPGGRGGKRRNAPPSD
jgi:uncharacterized membrane protein